MTFHLMIAVLPTLLDFLAKREFVFSIFEDLVNFVFWPLNTLTTVWKFFPITQILREINFEEFKSSKTFVLPF